MPSHRVLVFWTSLLALAWGISLPPLFADGDTDAKDQAAHRERMQRVAQNIHLFTGLERGKSEVVLKTEPVLRYTDPTRKQYDSGLWVWGAGRPAAIMAIEFYPKHPGGPRWLFEIASLSPERITANCGSDLNWTAKLPGLKLQELAGAPQPAEKATARLTQIKQLQRRFAATESGTVDGHIELRSLPTPIHRYTDEAAGVVDGAIMSFANGTNPEVLLILEAHGKTGAPGVWRYSLAQMTGAEVAVQVDGKAVWKSGEADPPATRDSYINGWLAEKK